MCYNVIRTGQKGMMLMLQSIKSKEEVQLTRADIREYWVEESKDRYRQFRVLIVEDTEDSLVYKVFKFHKVNSLDSFDCNITIKTKEFVLDKNDTKALRKHIRQVFIVDELGTDEEDVINYDYYVLDIKVLMDNLGKFKEEYLDINDFVKLFNESKELLFDSLDLKVFRD